MAGRVKSHHTPGPEAKYKSSFLNCWPLKRRTDAPDRWDVFDVSIAHSDGPWLAEFPVGTEIVMFGIWRFSEAVETKRPNPRDPSRTTTYVTHKLTLQPKFKRQVTGVE